MMKREGRTVMVFGVGTLQRSIIERARQMGLRTVGIDPLTDAACRDMVDVYEVVGGQDYEKTLEVANRYNVTSIVTAATDKPLVMMARIARTMGLPFYSVETAEWSTDKFRMKQRFLEAGIPCARGRLVTAVGEVEDLEMPLVVKPRDNSGSRGVKVCRNKEELAGAFREALAFSKMESLLVEEFIEGQEYSIEAIHQHGKSAVLQFTEKTTTPFPYNVEMAHCQPARLSEDTKTVIRKIVSDISDVMHFDNCASHTELKINARGIFVIETSPRLGGDMITSPLVPLSTGVNMEDLVLRMAEGEEVCIPTMEKDMASCVRFLDLPEGVVQQISPHLSDVMGWPGVVDFDFGLQVGDSVPAIHSSLDRFGHIVIKGKSSDEVERRAEKYTSDIIDMIKIRK